MTTRVARRSLLTLLQLLLLLLLTSPALAAGRLEWKSKTMKEREDKSWRVEVAIYLPRAPDVAHVPMKFEFMPEVYYERSMMDGDKLVERKVPLENRQALIESVDVGFLDSGSGNIEKRTRFSFKVTRAHGYEAGEYKITVRDTRNGQVIGQPTTLIFEGENEIIDRRAMVFTGKEKKKDDKPKEADKPKEEAAEEKAAEETEPAAEETAAAEDSAEAAEDTEAAEDDDPDGEIKEKPGGCGCRIEDTRNAGGAPLVLGLALFAGLFARRRRA
jgi:MYXO-CTERM domain-containing protein